jgi:hypothetical protein
VNLEQLRRGGKAELRGAVDAAILEAFILHARSLIEFLWCSDDPGVRAARVAAATYGQAIVRKKPHRDDVLAEHYFDPSYGWHPSPPEMSLLLATTHDKSNYGIAHCSFKRLDPEEARGWEHAEITRELAGRFVYFARHAGRAHLDQRAAIDIEGECSRALGALPIWPDDPLQIVGTPSFAAGSVATPPLQSVYAPRSGQQH